MYNDKLNAYIKRVETAPKVEAKVYDFEYLKLLFKALSNIKEDVYYKSESLKYKQQKKERSFCYELYHQLKVIKPCDEIQINGEIGKYSFINERQLEMLGLNYEKFVFSHIFPDLVIHRGQGDSYFKNQRIIIEAKHESIDETKIAKDLVKLANGIKLLNFQFAVFISINTDYAKLKTRIKEILKQLPKDVDLKLLRHILVINIKSGAIIEFDTLEDIVFDTPITDGQLFFNTKQP